MELKSRHEEVLRFIEDFKSMHREEIIDLFSNGYCYYFCIILIERFKLNKEAIYYIPIYNHFITKIGKFYYDINGIVLNKNYMKVATKWNKYKREDPLEAERIIRDCIKKESYNE